jgi:hypothetical protein
MLVGYKLLDAKNNEIMSWGGIYGQCPDIPNPLILPNGDHICGMSKPGPVQDWYIAEWHMLEPVIVPDTISRRQCATKLKRIGLISQEEAVAMAANATVPAFIQSFFAKMDPEARDDAELLMTAQEFKRNNPVLVAAFHAGGMKDTDIDDFFISAATY